MIETKFFYNHRHNRHHHQKDITLDIIAISAAWCMNTANTFSVKQTKRFVLLDWLTNFVVQDIDYWRNSVQQTYTELIRNTFFSGH